MAVAVVADLVPVVGLVLVRAVDLVPVPDLLGRLDHENGHHLQSAQESLTTRTKGKIEMTGNVETRHLRAQEGKTLPEINESQGFAPRRNHRCILIPRGIHALLLFGLFVIMSMLLLLRFAFLSIVTADPLLLSSDAFRPWR